MSDRLYKLGSIHLDDLLFSVGVGTWDWDLTTGTVIYSEAWAKILGYAASELPKTVETWEERVFPDDLASANLQIQKHLSGESPIYEAEFRMSCKDGSIIWTQDKGRVTEYSEDGKPLRFTGVLQNVDGLKRSEMQLTEALSALEYSNTYLEREVESRTKEIVDHDSMLWTVNRVSRKLLTFQSTGNFDELVQDCLRLIGERVNRNRVYIWKDRADSNGIVHCTQIYEWTRGVISIQGNLDYVEIPYNDLPNFSNTMDNHTCLNSTVEALAESEKRILVPQGIKSILIAPIAVNGKRWGFIGVDNCEDDNLFTSIEENMLLMSGSMLANTIEKMERDAELHEIEERTQLMLDATPLCCNLWTPDFYNMTCNQEAVRLFELNSQQEYLDKFTQLSPKYQPCGRLSDELAVEYLKIAFQNGYYRFEWLHQKLDGTPIPSEITLVRIKYRGSFIVAGYTRDLREFKKMLSELRSIENDLRTARDEALLNSKTKSNFLANMSHEIRTPMNAISGLTEIILRETSDDKIIDYAKSIRAASNSLLNIINDILDISKIESGKLEIFNTPYELNTLLNEVITIARMRIGDKPLMFITNIDSKLPLSLIGDEIRIKQILINLLSNAIKFTNSGYIALRVSGNVGEDCTNISFSVSDSGVGIKDDDFSRLFAEFERVNTTKNRSIEGTGLGLAITKRLCEMMGGSIRVDSIYEKGSTFTVTIPQENCGYQRLAQVYESKNVLLYEPRELYRTSIEESLKNLDCTYISCTNQSEVYDNISSMPYDYVLIAALHKEKMELLLNQHKLSIPMAVFTSYNEQANYDDATEILFPINCFQLAHILNGYDSDCQFPMADTAGFNFIAPTANVLIVDDNPVNLLVAEGLMLPYGFHIDTATNGIEAIKLVKSNKYDLVFMDHMMPEMDGIDATVAIRQLNGDYYKNLPIVALTANAIVGTREMFIREGMSDFLAKPIEINKLSHILMRWLPASKIVKSFSKGSVKSPDKPTSIKISGINTVQGILSVGGSLENYLQILSSYYYDSTQKCLSLVHHIKERDISAFRTEVHAIKSTSATIGALEVSTLAAKLELAAQNNDVAFIENNIELFIKTLNILLHSICPVLQSELPESFKKTSSVKPKGDIIYLREILEQIYSFAEFANTSQLEEQILKIRDYSWDSHIEKELSEIEKLLAVFDYDAILDNVTNLQELIK